jgi:Holliday junction resolvase-like predicted endonuclease
LDKKHKGAMSELTACSYLLNSGYEVFRNVSPFGPIDIIAIKDGKEFKLDVKTLHPSYKEVGNRLTKEQIEQGVLPLFVNEAGGCRLPKEMHPTQ